MNQDLNKYLFTSISSIPNVGESKKSLFLKLNIRTFRDLLLYLPYDYINRAYAPAIYDIEHDDILTLDVTVEDIALNLGFNKNKPSKILCRNESGTITLVYFNKIPPYIKKLFVPNTEIIISGKASIKGHEIYMPHPDIVVHKSEKYKIPKIESIYQKTPGITSRLIAYLVQGVLRNMPKIDEWISQEILEKNQWSSFIGSLCYIHSPSEVDNLKMQKARQRLAFDEVLYNQISMQELKNKFRESLNEKGSMRFGDLKKRFLESLPFQLTQEQKNVLLEIEQDQRSLKRMLRLLQGDVGCGKTIVAISAALNAIESGYQVAFMVPTEILAYQHYNNCKNLLSSLDVRTDLLVGSMSAKNKKLLLKQLENNEIDLLIGTHALFQDAVAFSKLGLVVIDEQHRFGVHQRALLNNKSEKEAQDLLMLSATPIPRTMSMVFYGDIDVSTIKNKPISNVPIITKLLSQSKIDDLAENLTQMINAGNRIYWVCPLIEESEKLDLAYVEERFGYLKEKVSNAISVLHGKMTFLEKQKVMEDFKVGNISVLVATTVIEVGIDVPEATIMVIENAERFGLSQLHQLRGRVGRGKEKSYCVLLYGNKLSKEGRQRLDIFRKHTDGFVIAEKDLKIRGAGEYFGTRQSGDQGFRFFDIITDQALVVQANKMARDVGCNKTHTKNLLSIFSNNTELHNVMC